MYFGFFEQPVSNKGCSSIQFPLREYNKVFRGKKVPFPEILDFLFQGVFFFFFFELRLKKVAQVVAYIITE